MITNGKPILDACCGSRMFWFDKDRLMYFQNMHGVSVMAQPYIDMRGKTPPYWQKDMARWANRRWIYKSCDFKDYRPRKGINGKMILERNKE